MLRDSFNSIVVRLKGFVPDFVTAYKIGFNSIVVRLKECAGTGAEIVRAGFNSIVVRLKEILRAVVGAG